MDVDKLLKIDVNEDEIALMLKDADEHIQFDHLLDRYGPEGLYLIADKLKQVADYDMRAAIEQGYINEI